ncbi:MAG: 16S rRNA (cytidine(1402)-2'-O)-methyltransferase [Deltaproteobacteria bacterium]|nr:MAG: 16S rRNA (cytidine(1402)-2'-O)-methyltransferase [Deltaproteobacteria bacterium]
MKQREGRGNLYLVSTPIGNLEDVTLRALKVLKEVDVIAAEDTRRTRILLRHYGIERPILSFFEGNERRRTEEILELLEQGKDVALLCDAGTPTVSDPGYRLVRAVREKGMRVVPIPGPTAVIAALSASGLPTDSFSFFGFLPPKGAKRKRRLQEIARSRPTVILFESPKRLPETLRDLLQYCGNRRVVIARELTKLHEEFICGELSTIIEEMKERSLKGEVTIVMEGLGWR